VKTRHKYRRLVLHWFPIERLLKPCHKYSRHIGWFYVQGVIGIFFMLQNPGLYHDFEMNQGMTVAVNCWIGMFLWGGATYLVAICIVSVLSPGHNAVFHSSRNLGKRSSFNLLAAPTCCFAVHFVQAGTIPIGPSCASVTFLAAITYHVAWK
jgi:hypothetical protein